MEREYITKIKSQFPLALPEIIRCKDCEHRINGEWMCAMDGTPVEENHYCGHGRQKEDDEDG